MVEVLRLKTQTLEIRVIFIIKLRLQNSILLRDIRVQGILER